jgi:hypothetical protein
VPAASQIRLAVSWMVAIPDSPDMKATLADRLHLNLPRKNPPRARLTARLIIIDVFSDFCGPATIIG